MIQDPIGKRQWLIPGGHIPLDCTGREPEFTSNDKFCILNTADGEAKLELTFFYTDSIPIGPYRVEVAAQRAKHVRFNDLIDPFAIPLGTPFACEVKSDVPVVVQFTRQDTGWRANAGFTTMAFPVTDEA